MGIDDLVFEAIEDIEKDFPVDDSRRYVTGASMGGIGTWHFLATRPEMFAAGLPVCAPVPGDPAIAEKVAGIPVWVFHGRHDNAINVQVARDMVAAIKAAGGDPKYTEFPDASHSDLPMGSTPGIMEWLFAQHKY